MRTAVMLFLGCSGALVIGLLLGAAFAAAERAADRDLEGWWEDREQARRAVGKVY